MNQKRMINTRMQKINENTFGIRPKFIIKDSTQDFLSGNEMSDRSTMSVIE